MFPERRAGEPREVSSLRGLSSLGQHVAEGGAYCPLLVVPISLLQGFRLHLQLLDTGLGFSHGVRVEVGRVVPGQAVSSHGATCFTEIVTGQPAPQQSPVHVDVGGNELVDTQPQD